MSSRGKQRATEGPAAPSLQPAKGKHRLRPQEKAEQDVVNSLSTSRLKAAIRQSKRFLARDELTPATRVETERRLEALEAQLGRAEAAQRERKNATRYHGIKFFERTKTLRKIKQAKTVVEAAQTKPEKKAAYRALREARIDLHYILTFPNDRKYISLYPDGSYVPHERSPEAPASDDPETDAARAAMREDIRKQMKAEKLAIDPEVELEQRAADEPVAQAPAPRKKKPRSARAQPAASGPPRPSKPVKSSGVKPTKIVPDADLPIADDDFFEA